MSAGRFSICQLTTPDTSFEQDLELTKNAGAAGIALAEDKFRDGEDEALLEAFRASGLKATVCLPTNIGVLPVRPAMLYAAPEDPEERVGLMCESVRRMAPFEPDMMVVITGSQEGYSRREAEAIVIENLREVANVAAEVGTRLGLEACRRDLGFDGSFVQGLPATIDLIEKIDHPNLGITYDTYHHWDEPEAVARAEEFAGRVFGAQVNDWREPPRCYVDRLAPGEGTIDLPPLLAALERGGFTGWYDFELFSDDGRWGTDLPDSLWKLPPQELVDRGLKGMQTALATAQGV
jgi:sugar phosphate isomerase/epimerase